MRRLSSQTPREIALDFKGHRFCIIKQPLYNPTLFEKQLLYGDLEYPFKKSNPKKPAQSAQAFTPNHQMEIQLTVLRAILSGDNEKTKQLLHDHPERAIINTAIKAAGYTKNKKLISTLSKMGGDVDLFIFGAAVAGYFDWVNQLLDYHRTPRRLEFAARGAAMINHEITATYQAQGANAQGIIFTYGITRNIRAAAQLLSQNPGIKDGLLTSLAIGAGIGGHRDINALTRKKRIGINNYILLGAAMSGDHAFMTELLALSDTDITSGIIGLTLGGFFIWAESLRKSIELLFDTENKDMVQRMISAAESRGHDHFALYLQNKINKPKLSLPPIATQRTQGNFFRAAACAPESDDETFTLSDGDESVSAK